LSANIIYTGTSIIAMVLNKVLNKRQKDVRLLIRDRKTYDCFYCNWSDHDSS